MGLKKKIANEKGFSVKTGWNTSFSNDMLLDILYVGQVIFLLSFLIQSLETQNPFKNKSKRPKLSTVGLDHHLITSLVVTLN